jgi:5-methylcytosine-specific restriction endonuclease McrA
MFNYHSTQWETKRQKILRRDGYKCQECKRYGRMKQATTVHHILPSAEYSQYALLDINLISLCDKCHNSCHNRNTDELTETGINLLKRIFRSANRIDLIPPKYR